MRIRGLGLVIAVVACVGFFGGRAFTEDEKGGDAGAPDMSLMQPGEEHAVFKDMVGAWNIAGELWMAPGQPSTKTKSKATFELIMGGRYLLQKVKGEAFFPGGEPFEGMSVSGYDRVAKQYHGTWYDNMGTGVMSSTGQASKDGKVMTMTGKADFGTGPMDFREVHTCVGPKEFTLEMFMKDAEHPEMRVMRLVYTRE